MANFVESATLKVVDSSSAQINRINNELKKLQQTARSLKSTQINLTVNSKSIVTATSELAKLNAQLKALGSARSNLNVNTANLTKATSEARNLAQAVKAVSETKLNISANTEGLNRAKEQIAQLRAEASRPIKETVEAAVAGGRRGRRAGAAAEERPSGPGVALGVGAGGVFKNALGLGLGMLGLQTLHEFGKAIKEGTKDLDAGETKLKLLQLDRILTGKYTDAEAVARGKTPETVATELIRELAAEKSKLPGGGFLNTGQRTALYAETFGTAASLKGAKELASGLEELVRTGVGLGQSFDTAQEKAYNYAKAADMMGRLVYNQAVGEHEKGTFRTEGITPEELKTFRESLTPQQIKEQDQGKPWALQPRDVGMKNFFGYMQQIQSEIGKEFTGSFVQQISKYLGSTRFGVGNRALGATLLLGEEQGTQAALGYRQAVKQLSGIEQTVARSQNLAAMGLITGHMQGKAWVTDKILDPALLARDLPQYLAKYMAPDETGKKPEPLQKAEKRFGREFDPSKFEDMQFLANKLVGNSRAIDTVSNYLFNAAEVQRKLDLADKRDPSKIREDTKDSLNIAGQQLSNQFEGLAGATVKLFGPELAKGGQYLSEGMAGLATTISERRAKGPITQGEINTMIVGGLGALAAAPVVKGVGEALGLITSPLGTAYGMQAMLTAKEPATKSLGAAGVSLNAAGTSLNAAGTSLLGVGGALLRTLGSPAALAAAILAASTRPAGGLTGAPNSELDKLSTANDDLYKSTNALRGAQEDLKVAQDPAEIERLGKVITEAQQKIDHANQVIGTTKLWDEALPPPLPPKPPLTVQDLNALPKRGQPIVLPTEKPAWLDLLDQLLQPKPRTALWPSVDEVLKKNLQGPSVTAPPPALPAPSFEQLTPVGSSMSDLTAATSQFSSSFGASISELTSSASMFEAVLGSGASTLSSALTGGADAVAGSGSIAGGAIASAMMGAASSAGSVFGSVAAGAISAAASNIHVSVDAHVAGGRPVDTGTQPAG